ncbi:MAG: HPr kinase/phosphatase C-terminal domain-containing protein [Pseudomonadota bacterium]
MATSNLVHATGISIGGKAVLIRGPSGSGKTQTAITIIRRGRMAGLDVGLIADDQTRVTANDMGGLTASCPETIAGQIEVFGFGVYDASAIRSEPAAIALIADLVPDQDVARMPPQAPERLLDIFVPALKLPQRQPNLACHAVFAAIGIDPWL